jgi:hypothetical protein
VEAAPGPASEDTVREQAMADFFWPVFPMLGWGIAVAFNAWDVYGRRPLTEDQIRREMERLRS